MGGIESEREGKWRERGKKRESPLGRERKWREKLKREGGGGGSLSLSRSPFPRKPVPRFQQLMLPWVRLGSCMGNVLKQKCGVENLHPGWGDV